MLIQVEEQLTHFTLGSDVSMVEEQILSEHSRALDHNQRATLKNAANGASWWRSG